MDYSLIEEICQKNGCVFEKQHPLAPHTSMKIGGNCDIMVKPENEQTITQILTLCHKKNIPFFILGKGSNLLVSSEGYHGCVIKPSGSLCDITVNGNDITAGAGASLSSVCLTALEHSLTGLEFAYGIPGSVGGALYMNAGAYGGEMKDIVKSCRYISENGDICEMKSEDMKLRYRGSIFCDRPLCILSVTLALKTGEKDAIKARMDELMQKRRDKQPLEFPSCGSTFKRPDGYFAAALIEECGLKGYSIGGAQVSEKHSGFVINRNNATYEDVMALVEHIRATVLREKGVKLECEMLILK